MNSFIHVLPIEIKTLILSNSVLSLKDLLQFAFTSKSSYHSLLEVHNINSLLNNIRVKLEHYVYIPNEGSQPESNNGVSEVEDFDSNLKILISHQCFENPLYKYQLNFEINSEGLYIYFQILVLCILQKLNIVLDIHEYYETEDIPSHIQIEISQKSNKSYVIFRSNNGNNTSEYYVECKNCLYSFSKLASYGQLRLEKQFNQNIKEMYHPDLKQILEKAK